MVDLSIRRTPVQLDVGVAAGEEALPDPGARVKRAQAVRHPGHVQQYIVQGDGPDVRDLCPGPTRIDPQPQPAENEHRGAEHPNPPASSSSYARTEMSRVYVGVHAPILWAWQARRGVSPPPAQALARHAKIETTMAVYTDVTLLDLRGGVEGARGAVAVGRAQS